MDIETEQINPTVKKEINEMEMPMDMQLEIYYDKFFPYKTFIKWLNCTSKEDTNHTLERREFSFTLDGEIYIRFLSFKDQEKFKSELVSKKPIKIDVGAIYNVPPSQKNTFVTKDGFKAEEKEFVIDIDMTDYDQIRTCCKGPIICIKCWKFLKLACLVLEKALNEDFGFENILWVFSGRRGIHCWVCDPQAKDMKNEARNALVDYLSLVSGNNKAASQIKPNVLKKNKHPSVKRALGILKGKFEEIMLNDQNVFDKNNASIFETVLNMIEEPNDKNEIINEWNRRGKTSEDKWEILSQFIDRKIAERTVQKKSISNKTGISSINLRAYKRLKHLKEELILMFLYPRLDAHVSTDIGHLLKTPFSIHPKTGKVCVPFKTEDLNTFDPFAAPALKDLIADYNLDGEHEEIYQKKMFEYYKGFDDFVRKLEKFCQKYQLDNKKKKSEGKLDF